MLQGLYAAASGMEAQQTQLNAISNDLANADTPGYESVNVGFQDLLYSSGGVSTGSPIATGAGASASVVGRNTTEGALNQTGRPLDVGIEGDGYLQVRLPNGQTGLTRDGALQLNSKGQLTDANGDPLVPTVTVPNGTDIANVKIAADGTVTLAGKPLGAIKLVTVPAPGQLLADGNSTFSVTAASGTIKPATGASLHQGMLEQSNVDMAQAMAGMMNAQESYDMDSQAVQYQSQMLQIANQLRSGS
ncbi:MAG TPA: flagellar hook-basal body protein [Solirubrobacteraceae bacterium]|nr:flagellar hook-basal body protein [Solirubrobacteraceae bacterium]